MSAYQHHWQDGRRIELNCSKIVCVGKNYADHILEMNSATPTQPVLFIKPPTALCDANQPIKVSHLTHLGALHHELEIALLIGKSPTGGDTNISKVIAGVGLGIDLTLRDVQTELKEQGLPWERAKAFDGSCALSPFIPFDANSDSLDLANISLELILNGQRQQHGNSKFMLNPIPALLSNINQVFSLRPGDVVLTGTPAGVGPLSVNDHITARLNGRILIDDTSVI